MSLLSSLRSDSNLHLIKLEPLLSTLNPKFQIVCLLLAKILYFCSKNDFCARINGDKMLDNTKNLFILFIKQTKNLNSKATLSSLL